MILARGSAVPAELTRKAVLGCHIVNMDGTYQELEQFVCAGDAVYVDRGASIVA